MTEPSDPKSTPPEPTTAEPGSPASYEAPALTELGSVRELTQGVPDPGNDVLNMGSTP